MTEEISLYLLLTSWMFLCFFLTTIYSTELASKMTIPEMTPLIESFEELIFAQKEGRAQIYAKKGSYYLRTIKVFNKDYLYLSINLIKIFIMNFSVI